MNTQQHKKFTILLIGDSCIDEYVYGSVDRLSPEAPVPVIKLKNKISVPGMAANVKLNLQQLNCDIDFITNDVTNLKVRYIDQRSLQHLLRVDSDPHIPPWNRKLPFPIVDYDAVVISDYNKGFLTYDLIESIIADANGIPVFIDTKKQDLARFSAGWSFIKINEYEYNNRHSQPENLIVTIGSEGAMLKLYDKEIIFPTSKVNMVDVCGCGDTFLSALCYQYLVSKDLQDAIKFANKAASITVQHRGNYAPTLNDIENA